MGCHGMPTRDNSGAIPRITTRRRWCQLGCGVNSELKMQTVANLSILFNFKTRFPRCFDLFLQTVANSPQCVEVCALQNPHKPSISHHPLSKPPHAVHRDGGQLNWPYIQVGHTTVLTFVNLCLKLHELTYRCWHHTWDDIGPIPPKLALHLSWPSS